MTTKYTRAYRKLVTAAFLASLAITASACGGSNTSDGSSELGGAAGAGGSTATGGSSSGGSSGGGGSSTCSTKTLACGTVASTEQLTSVFGQAPVTYDEAGHPHCSFKLTSGSGGVQVFCGDVYDSMLGGAKQGYPTATTETNDIGTRSCEVNTTDVVEVGFLTTGGNYTVLVSLVLGAADIANARELAKVVDQNLSAQ